MAKIRITKVKQTDKDGIFHEGIFEKHEVPYPFIIREHTDEGGHIQFRVEFVKEEPHADYSPEIIEAFHERKDTIDGHVKVLGLNIVIDGDHTDTEIDLGSLTLQAEGREFILDAVQSYRTFEDGQTTIQVDLERDDETFPECKYDLTSEDLYLGDLSAKFFFSCEEDWEHCTLFVKIGGCTKAIDVQLD